MLWLVILLACYLGLAYLTHYTKGVYVYPFLNSAPKKLDNDGKNIGGIGVYSAAYIVGIAVGIVVLFGVSKGLISLRKWAIEKKGGMMGKFYGGRALGHGEADLEEQKQWETQPGEA